MKQQLRPEKQRVQQIPGRRMPSDWLTVPHKFRLHAIPRLVAIDARQVRQIVAAKPDSDGEHRDDVKSDEPSR